MKGNQIARHPLHPDRLALTLILIFSIGLIANAQAPSGGAQPPASATPTVGNPAPDASGVLPSVTTNSPAVATDAGTLNAKAAAAAAEADALRKRIERARALAAAHQLSSAATELESIRATAKDDVVRTLSSLMLMGIYLEDGNYARSEAMLEESFKERSTKNEGSVQNYFALAGQAVNGARFHVARYRGFGIDVSETELPKEALSDLDRLRSLLERMASQAKDLINEKPKSSDAYALLEDICGIRVALSRDRDDRSRWQTEFSAARAKLQTLPADASVTTPSLSNLLAQATSQPANVERVPGSNSPASEKPTLLTATGAAQSAASTADAGSNSAVIPAANKDPSLLEVGSLLEKATTQIKPNYPQFARNSGTSGLVRVKLVVDETGSVANIVWTEGPMQLRQAALDAVRQWKFRPTLIDGKPVRVAGYIDFGFTR